MKNLNIVIAPCIFAVKIHGFNLNHAIFGKTWYILCGIQYSGIQRECHPVLRTSILVRLFGAKPIPEMMLTFCLLGTNFVPALKFTADPWVSVRQRRVYKWHGILSVSCHTTLSTVDRGNPYTTPNDLVIILNSISPQLRQRELLHKFK